MVIVYDREGKPVSLLEWSKLCALGVPYRRIAASWLRGWMVSTVWIGIDHSYGSADRPLIFETMVFDPSGMSAGYQERHATEHEAGRGHGIALAWLTERLGASLSEVVTVTRLTLGLAPCGPGLDQVMPVSYAGCRWWNFGYRWPVQCLGE